MENFVIITLTTNNLLVKDGWDTLLSPTPYNQETTQFFKYKYELNDPKVRINVMF
jgi:hypothetical protein